MQQLQAFYAREYISFMFKQEKCSPICIAFHDFFFFFEPLRSFTDLFLPLTVLVKNLNFGDYWDSM